jgi:thiamine-phosphate pyrophosphorylase
MSDSRDIPRLFLVTPDGADPESFAGLLAEALAAGDVAAVLITAGADPRMSEARAARLVPLIQAAGAAALVEGDTRIAGHTKADGVHVGSGLGDLRNAAESFRPSRIVGAGNLHSRHTAMEAGEVADYVFFGQPHGDTHDEPHPKALDLAEWWADLMEVPAVIMAGRSLTTLPQAVATGAAFVALHHAVWAHEAGPAEAVRRAAAALAGEGAA